MLDASSRPRMARDAGHTQANGGHKVNRLTAYRSFGNPGFTPTRSFRIYSKRWYICTFQNTEHDIGGGHYLAEGEYSELLPGIEARRARDSQLNHLNAIREHKGSIWSVRDPQRCNRITYHASQSHAKAKANEIIAKTKIDWAICEKHQLATTMRTNDDLTREYGQCSDWHGPEAYRAFWGGLHERNRAYYATQPTIVLVK